jgi:hypothetical protein
VRSHDSHDGTKQLSHRHGGRNKQEQIMNEPYELENLFNITINREQARLLSSALMTGNSPHPPTDFSDVQIARLRTMSKRLKAIATYSEDK